LQTGWYLTDWKVTSRAEYQTGPEPSGRPQLASRRPRKIPWLTAEQYRAFLVRRRPQKEEEDVFPFGLAEILCPKHCINIDCWSQCSGPCDEKFCHWLRKFWAGWESRVRQEASGATRPHPDATLPRASRLTPVWLGEALIADGPRFLRIRCRSQVRLTLSPGDSRSVSLCRREIRWGRSSKPRIR
jgi:hypothetical protein